MNALRLLMTQHDRIEGLLVDLRQASERDDAARRSAAAQLAQETRRHFETEESCFYSVVASKLILVEADRFLREHRSLREQLERLEAAAGSGGPEFARAYEALHDAIVQHVGDEEIELFPEVKRRFNVDELDAIGATIERAMQGEPAPERAEAPIHSEP